MDRLVVSRRSWIAALLLLAAAVGIMLGVGEATRTPTPTDALPDGYDSTTAAELAQRLPDEGGSAALVLYASDQRVDRADLAALQERYRAVLDELGDAVAAAPTGGAPDQQGQDGQNQGGDQGPALLPSEDGTAALGVLEVEAAGATETQEVVDRLRELLQEGLPDGVSAEVTGPAAIQADLAAVFEGADVRLILVTAGVVAVLLLVTYRSPLLWIVPLVVVGVADRLAATLATQTLSLTGVTWDESTVGILSVLVFGAGTDYALLLISRYRDELRVEEDRVVAMRHALRETFEAVASSAVTVVVGLLTLLLSVLPSTRGLGLACAVGVLVAAFFALVVLPAALVGFGRWIFWPLVPRVGQTGLADSERSVWHRVGVRVRRRPTGYAAAAVVLLALLAAGLPSIQTGLAPADQFLREPEAISAGKRLAESFPAGSSDPATVITRADPAEVVRAAEGVDGVESARPASEGDGLAQVDVVLSDPTGSAGAAATIERLREAMPDQTWVGGSQAESVDAAAAASRDRGLIIPLVLGLVLLALAGLLRSLVAPIVLVTTVVGTYLASLGVSWWIFTQVLGFERLDDGVPLLAFLFLVALGVDYNIFLVTRARSEARRHGHGEGFLRALTATGGVITSAGILLAAVFAVLGVLPLVVLAQLGVVVCVGVLLDTLLVRTVLVPAVAWRLGPTFWKPAHVEPSAKEIPA